MVAEALYTRVPPELKAAVEAYADGRAMTTSACVAELLQVGYEAVGNGRSIAALTARVDELESELAAETMRRQDMERQAAGLGAAVETWSTRAKQTIGKCPKCTKDLSGADVMVTGSCSHCGTTVAPKVDLNNGVAAPEWYLLAGAAGVVLGMLLAGAIKK